MNYSKEVSEKLNNLLTKNYDAEAGYKKAAEEVKDPTLKNYFKDRAQSRYDFGHELKSEIKSFGQEPDKGTSVKGDAHRFWMDVKSTFSSDNEEAILEEAIRGEKAAVQEYKEVIESTTLPPSTANVLMKQRQNIESALSSVKAWEEMA